MDRSLGNKRKKIAENGNEKGIGFITNLYGNFEENEFVKILPNEYFGYWRVTVEQPLKDEKGKIVKSKGNPKPDTALRDYENIPFLKKDKDGNLVPQTIEEYFEREVKPHLPEAWIDESKTKTGYEINFTKYFYEFKPLRSLSEIKADILELEERTFGRAHKVLEI
jgi:type I restriction enzyme M protein